MHEESWHDACALLEYFYSYDYGYDEPEDTILFLFRWLGPTPNARI